MKRMLTGRRLIVGSSAVVALGLIAAVLMTNPGVWMAHCHIAEHIESGMMLNFQVDNRAAASGTIGTYE